MITVNAQEGLIRIGNDFGERSGVIINQIFDRKATIKVEAVEEANVEQVRSVVGDPALMVQMPWGTTQDKIVLLAHKETLPDIFSALSEQKEGEPQAVLEVKETITHIFGDLSVYLLEQFNENVEFANPEVKLWTVTEDDEIIKDKFLMVLTVDAGEDLKTRICQLFPQTIVNTLFKEKEEVQEEKTVISPGNFEELTDKGSISISRNLDTLMDLELPIVVELGRVKMQLKDILELGPGGIVELSKFSGEPVDLFVNSKKFAEGEVVVIDQNFGVRITALVSQKERIANLESPSVRM